MLDLHPLDAVALVALLAAIITIALSGSLLLGLLMAIIIPCTLTGALVIGAIITAELP